MMFTLFGHVKWFTSSEIVKVSSLNGAEWATAVLIISLGLFTLKVVTQWLLKNKIYLQLDKKLFSYRSVVPFFVRISTTLFLLINAFDNQIISSNIVVTNNFTVYLIRILFVISALFIGLGLATRLASGLLLFGYLLTFTQTNIVNVLDHLEYVAIAGFLWFAGPGKISIDAWLGRIKQYTDKTVLYGVEMYRVFLGMGLVIMAFSEKLLNMSAASDFLAHHNWNLLSFADVSNRLFIIGAGSVELLIGLAILFNLVPRVIISALLFMMITTAVLLGLSEVYGHLFAIGAVAVFWVYDTRTNKD